MTTSFIHDSETLRTTIIRQGEKHVIKNLTLEEVMALSKFIDSVIGKAVYRARGRLLDYLSSHIEALGDCEDV